MNNSPLILILCFSIILSSIACTDKKADLKITGDTKIHISLNENDINNIKRFDSCFDNTQVLYLKTPDSLFIASIKKIIFFRKKIFILDKKFSSVLCFDQDGNFLMQYGKIGLGNNEFKAIEDFDIDSIKSQLVIFSNEDLSLYFYSLDRGTFITKKYIGLYASSFCLLPFNRIVFYKDYKIDKKTPNYNILIIDSSNNIIGKFLPFNPNLSTISWSSITGFLTKYNNEILFSDAFNDSIFSYKNTDEVSLFSFIDINSNAIQENRQNHEKLLHSGIIIDSFSRFLHSHVQANKDYMVFNYQSEKRIKIAIYKIDDQDLQIMTSKNSNDPLLALSKDLMFLDNDNNLTFAISPENILDLKQKKPMLYCKLP